jgi:hypothetical protein
MSLDVYLIGEAKEQEETCYACGHTHTKEVVEEFYSSNITHNLAQMADRAGIYKPIWRPDEIGITHARQLIEPLTTGLKKLQDNPNLYEQYNSTNGWGTYQQFIPWVVEYLEACKQYPDAKIEVSR